MTKPIFFFKLFNVKVVEKNAPIKNYDANFIVSANGL